MGWLCPAPGWLWPVMALLKDTYRPAVMRRVATKNTVEKRHKWVYVSSWTFGRYCSSMTRGEQKTPHQNRIVRRTRVAVKNALMELIHEKNYPRISVQEIAEKADVGRSTLYSKADILVKI